MVFYGHGLVWDVEQNRILARFVNGTFKTDDKRVIELLRNRYTHDGEAVTEVTQEPISEPISEPIPKSIPEPIADPMPIPIQARRSVRKPVEKPAGKRVVR